MGVMTGQVRISVEMTGKGDAPQKVKETKDGIDKLSGASDSAGGAIMRLNDRLKEKVGVLKDGVGPVNLMREGLNFLRENAGFVGAAFASLTAIIGGVVSALDTGTVAMDRWEEAQGRMAEGAERTKNIIAGIEALLGKAPDKWETTIAGVRQRMGELTTDIAAGELAIKDMRHRMDGAIAAVPALGLLHDTLNASLIADQQQLNKLKSEQQRLDAANVELMEEQSKLTAEQVAMLNWLAGRQAAPKETKSKSPFLGFGGGEDDPALSLDGLIAAVRKARETVGRGAGTDRRKLTQAEIDELLGGPTAGDDLLALRDKQRDMWGLAATSKDLGFAGAANDNARLGAADQPSGHRRLAGDIRDVSSALAEGIPLLTEWSSVVGKTNADIVANSETINRWAGAISTVAQSWGDAAAANEKAAEVEAAYREGRASEEQLTKAIAAARSAETRGVIASVGAIAMAGAESIKNERLRAGVLATIHLGLGTALMFVPGAQQEAIGHLAGAAILGSVAIFGGAGGGKSGGAGRGSSSRSVARPLSERTESGAWTVNIFGGWFGTSSPQETAAALHALTRRGGGSGYVPTGRAA